jgi:hypothetical protein
VSDSDVTPADERLAIDLDLITVMRELNATVTEQGHMLGILQRALAVLLDGASAKQREKMELLMARLEREIMSDFSQQPPLVHLAGDDQHGPRGCAGRPGRYAAGWSGRDGTRLGPAALGVAKLASPGVGPAQQRRPQLAQWTAGNRDLLASAIDRPVRPSRLERPGDQPLRHALHRSLRVRYAAGTIGMRLGAIRTQVLQWR